MAGAARISGSSPGPWVPVQPRCASAFGLAGDVRAAIEDPRTALGDGAVKGHEFQVEVAARLRPWDEMVMPILAAHEGGAVLAVELHHVSGDMADDKADAPVVGRVGGP